MMATPVQHHAGSQGVVYRLPERLNGAGRWLWASDCAAAAIALAFCTIVWRDGSGPFIALTLTILIAAAIGRYHVNFAVHPSDQWYHTFGMAALGAVAGALVAALLALNWLGALASVLVWTPLAGAGSVYLHRLRRTAPYEGVLDYVREGRHGVSWHAREATLRMLDVIFAIGGALLLSPVIVATALVVLRDSGFPIIFRQERVGRHDAAFTMWKFRTMRQNAGAQWAQPGDSRITRTGVFLRRTSLDELPQLWNVIQGDMSLVGPRPEMREYADRFSRELHCYAQRHIRRPGLTGWAQLYFDRNFQPEDEPYVLRCDLFYVQNAGVNLYMYCLVKTAFELFSHRAV